MTSTISIGLDTENNIHDGTQDITRTLQIAFPQDISEIVAVFHLSAIGAFDHKSFPKVLISFVGAAPDCSIWREYYWTR